VGSLQQSGQVLMAAEPDVETSAGDCDPRRAG
jgi:hypothetical protein